MYYLFFLWKEGPGQGQQKSIRKKKNEMLVPKRMSDIRISRKTGTSVVIPPS